MKNDVEGYWKMEYFPISIGVGIVLSALFSFLCSRSSVPHYAGFFLLIGFLQTTTITVRLSDIVVSSLTVIGSWSHIPFSILGLTVLAIGNSGGELITNTFVANQVSVTSGVTACYGGPIMNIMFGVGVSTVYHSFHLEGEPIKFDPLPIPFWISICMLIFGLFCSVAILSWRGYHSTPFFAHFLIGYSILIYMVVILVATLQAFA
jgi:sodium/potassium/calcium exchanger 6